MNRKSNEKLNRAFSRDLSGDSNRNLSGDSGKNSSGDSGRDSYGDTDRKPHGRFRRKFALKGGICPLGCLAVCMSLLWASPVPALAAPFIGPNTPITPHYTGEEQSTDSEETVDGVVEISDAAGLLEIAKNPSGRYRLTADIEMGGVVWTPIPFSGSLDGNGFAILNLWVEGTGSSARKTYDGNRKEYDTVFAALFDVVESGAEIRNLTLLGANVHATTDEPCFLGSIAGYLNGGTIENCNISNSILSLWAHDRMFGVGGIAGYGYGTIKDCSAEITAVCTDTDAQNRDEQFMGGVCAAGFPDITGCTISIQGFDSDHGYVHNGGLVGMYMIYPVGNSHYGTITDNTVTGKITFFEDNTNRRAYCNGFIGEIMNWDFENGRNQYTDFVRDEVFEYSVDLTPHSCEGGAMREEIVEPLCDSFGYTAYVCENCGYTGYGNYRLKQHDLMWSTVTEPQVGVPGLERGTCSRCDYTEEKEIHALEPEITPEPTPELTPVPEEKPREQENHRTVMAVVLAVLLTGAALITGVLAARLLTGKKH